VEIIFFPKNGSDEEQIHIFYRSQKPEEKK
jgi:hypothetical protein